MRRIQYIPQNWINLSGSFSLGPAASPVTFLKRQLKFLTTKSLFVSDMRVFVCHCSWINFDFCACGTLQSPFPPKYTSCLLRISFLSKVFWGFNSFHHHALHYFQTGFLMGSNRRLPLSSRRPVAMARRTFLEFPLAT